MLLITHNLPKEKGDKKRWLEIATVRDWEWCNPRNHRVYSSNKRRRFDLPWGRPTIYSRVYTENLKNTFIWISFFVEKQNIKEDIPRFNFEEIGSYL